MEIYNPEDWENIKTLKEGKVYIIKNKKEFKINGYEFKTGINFILKKLTNLNEEKLELEGNILQNVLNDFEKIVRFYGFLNDGKSKYMLIEFIEGETLKEYLKKKRPLGDKEISILARELLQLLNYIHSKKIIHRDLSTSNIILDLKCNKWKLIDFGLSYDFSKTNSSKNYTGGGTKGYQAPEILARAGKAGRKSDIWSFGCLVIKMLGGKLSLPDDFEKSTNSRENKICFPIIPSHAHRYCKNFIKKCFFYDPVIRFDSSSLNSHPFITYLADNKNSLELIGRDHRKWIETTQKKKEINVDGKEFTFDDSNVLKVGSIPDGTIHLIFSSEFNQVIPDGAIPKSVKIVDFGVDGKGKFNQPLSVSNLHMDLTSLTLGNDYTYNTPNWFRSLRYLSIGTKREEAARLPSSLETFKYYGTLKNGLKKRNIPSGVINLLMTKCNGPIPEDAIPHSVNYFAWGIFDDWESIQSLKNLPPSIDDLTFYCKDEIFKQLQKKHIPDNITILLINGKLINLNNDQESFLHSHIIIN